MSAAVRTEGLTKRFGSRTAMDGLTLEVPAGEVFGFLGPNGAGKTTTVRLLGTLLRPTSGSAEVAGIPVTPDNAEEVRRRISVMPEVPGVYAKLTVGENLEYFAGLFGWHGAKARHRIDAALEAVGLADRRGDIAGTLSKGLRQRAALARTLLNDPEVLFLDEPTQGLDPEATQEVRELIVGLRARGATVFLTTHRLEEAERLCDRVGIVKTKLLAIGRPDDLRKEVFTPALEVGLRAPLADPQAVFRGVPGLHGWEATGSQYRLDVEDPAKAAPEVARALVACGADVLKLVEVGHSLEEVYLDIVGDS